MAMGLKAKIYMAILCSTLLTSCQDKRYFTVSKVKDAAKLATSETIIDKIVIGNEEKKILRIITIGRARFVCYTQAVVKAGIDLKKIEENDISIKGKQISLHLPSVEVINFSYPFDKFKVDRVLQDDDLFAKIDVKDMEELFRQSEIDIRNLLPYTGIIEATEQKTTQMLEMLLRTLGYKEIYITYRKGPLMPKINPKEIQ
ncbi:MAG: DUF4230 domain-containing protein [Bacteroidales bacterium]|nr:MAG: DUF4230 domain-containing protein [Bacteroidales bacterium]